MAHIRSSHRKSAFWLSSALLLATGSVVCADTIIEAVTAPSDKRKLTFNAPGVVRDVNVKEGDAIKVGQILAEQDDEADKSELERTMREATSTARVDYYQADLDLKRKVLERKKHGGDGFSEAEIQEAEADVTKGERQMEVAMLDHEGDKSKAKQQAVKVDRMQLHSPIEGFVQEILVHGGEYAEVQGDRAAIIVVKNDPAWVEIKELRSSQVAKLHVGEAMQVRYPGETDWMEGKIIFISPTTFPGTDSQLVRLELPNSQNKATGLSIQVKLPDDLAQVDTDNAVAKR